VKTRTSLRALSAIATSSQICKTSGPLRAREEAAQCQALVSAMALPGEP
jgi:hypothetical protein